MQPRRLVRSAILALTIAILAIGCTPPAHPSPSATGPSSGIMGTVTAGPVCPVERPGDPACARRPVAGAAIVALDASGAVVAQATSDAAGAYSMDLAAGAYTVEGHEVSGLMGTPPPTPVSVVAGTFARVDLQYDTGIR